jgi:hypothetical protein
MKVWRIKGSEETETQICATLEQALEAVSESLERQNQQVAIVPTWIEEEEFWGLEDWDGEEEVRW